MKCNMGKVDRIIRLIIGLVALAWGIMNGNIIADVIGGILLLTAIIGWCPLYLPFGVNTGCDIDTKER